MDIFFLSMVLRGFLFRWESVRVSKISGIMDSKGNVGNNNMTFQAKKIAENDSITSSTLNLFCENRGNKIFLCVGGGKEICNSNSMMLLIGKYHLRKCLMFLSPFSKIQ
jgi:hypothetical protein